MGYCCCACVQISGCCCVGAAFFATESTTGPRLLLHLPPLADHPPQHVRELLGEIGVVIIAVVGFVTKLSREHIPHQGSSINSSASG